MTTQRDKSAAFTLMQSGRFQEALLLLERVIENDPSNWNAEYLAGQCCRFVGDFPAAIGHLRRASRLEQEQSEVFVALGIALQQAREWPPAIEAFKRAIELAPDFELAYNSLAMTQKMMGELDKALHNYEAGANALARRIVSGMSNDASSPIFKHDHGTNHLWGQYALYGATHLAVHAGATSIAWSSGAAAEEEERTERHAGLYWTDTPKPDGGNARLYLPNFFNTFRHLLACSRSYADLIGNRGTILAMLGRQAEAEEHFAEATEFSRRVA